MCSGIGSCTNQGSELQRLPLNCVKQVMLSLVAACMFEVVACVSGADPV